MAITNCQWIVVRSNAHYYYTVHNIDDRGLYLHLVIDKMETYIFGCLLNTFCVGSEFQVTFPLSVFWRCKFQQISEY